MQTAATHRPKADNGIPGTHSARSWQMQSRCCMNCTSIIPMYRHLALSEPLNPIVTSPCFVLCNLMYEVHSMSMPYITARVKNAAHTPRAPLCACQAATPAQNCGFKPLKTGHRMAHLLPGTLLPPPGWPSIPYKNTPTLQLLLQQRTPPSGAAHSLCSRAC